MGPFLVVVLNVVLYQNSAYLQVMCLQMAVLLVDSVWSAEGWTSGTVECWDAEHYLADDARSDRGLGQRSRSLLCRNRRRGIEV